MSSLPQAADDVADELAGLLDLRHVAGERHGLAARGPDLAHEAVGRGLVAEVVDRHAGSRPGEELRRRPADPPGTPCNQGGSGSEINVETVGGHAPYIKLDSETFHKDRAAP